MIRSFPFYFVLTSSSNGIRVIRTRPSRRPALLAVRVDDTHHRTIGTSNHEESPHDNHERSPEDAELPLPVAVALVPVVVEPHSGHGLEGHESAEEGSDERHQALEDGDAAGDAVRDDGDGARAAEPGRPVLPCVGREVFGAAQDAHHEVFGCQLLVGQPCKSLTEQRGYCDKLT